MKCTYTIFGFLFFFSNVGFSQAPKKQKSAKPISLKHEPTLPVDVEKLAGSWMTQRIVDKSPLQETAKQLLVLQFTSNGILYYYKHDSLTNASTIDILPYELSTGSNLISIKQENVYHAYRINLINDSILEFRSPAIPTHRLFTARRIKNPYVQEESMVPGFPYGKAYPFNTYQMSLIGGPPVLDGLWQLKCIGYQTANTNKVSFVDNYYWDFLSAGSNTPYGTLVSTHGTLISFHQNLDEKAVEDSILQLLNFDCNPNVNSLKLEGAEGFLEIGGFSSSKKLLIYYLNEGGDYSHKTAYYFIKQSEGHFFDHDELVTTYNAKNSSSRPNNLWEAILALIIAIDTMPYSERAEIICPACDGKGYYKQTTTGGYEYTLSCSRCSGTGFTKN